VIGRKLSDVLGEFARTMVTDFPIQAILDHLVTRIVEVLPVTSAGVTLISPTMDPRYVAASNADALRFERLQTELGEGPCLAAYTSGTKVLVPDLANDHRFQRFAPRAVQAGLTAVFTFPLNHGDRRLGALDLYRDAAGELSSDAIDAAHTLADVAAAYLINAQARADLQDMSDRSRDAALHDALTGLPNRTLLLERLHHAFSRSRRSSKTSAVFFVDLDRFKTVNDSYGHEVGDQLLIATARRLADVLRPGDTLARLAGDEFVILCEELEDDAQADTIALRMDAELSEPFVLPTVEINLTASIGIAFTDRDIDSAEQVLHDADRAMYRTKRRRDPHHYSFDLRELQLAEDQTDLERSLPGAAERGELELAYQPIVAAVDALPAAAEALVRWKHPIRGLVAPTVLIPLAEQSGLISEVGSWVLTQACSDQQLWRGRHSSELAVAVNVSAHQFMSPGFADSIGEIVDGASIKPEALILEVTESVFVGDANRALAVFDALNNLGVRLSLDDFGTGYSSLSYLMNFLVDSVKVDRAFTANLVGDPASQTIVSAIIDLAHDLGISVVAEGVETAQQHLELARLGCDFCQGYYFAVPGPASHLDSLLERDAGRLRLSPAMMDAGYPHEAEPPQVA
jgi:diguanylate cyclase (GGDEF)-like protein